jgi:uncharacterized protein with FMN-binding domain
VVPAAPLIQPEAPPVTEAVTVPVPEVKVEVPLPPASPPAPKWKDGTYTGWGTSRHGDIQSSVVIEGGRIVSATIAQCQTRYSCSVIDALPPQVIKRQSPDVDSVSGATQSADAFYYGVVEALGKAK